MWNRAKRQELRIWAICRHWSPDFYLLRGTLLVHPTYQTANHHQHHTLAKTWPEFVGISLLVHMWIDCNGKLYSNKKIERPVLPGHSFAKLTRTGLYPEFPRMCPAWELYKCSQTQTLQQFNQLSGTLRNILYVKSMVFPPNSVLLKVLSSSLLAAISVALKVSTSAQMIFMPAAAETRVEGAGASTEKRKYLQSPTRIGRLGPQKTPGGQNKTNGFRFGRIWILLCQDAGSRLVAPWCELVMMPRNSRSFWSFEWPLNDCCYCFLELSGPFFR